MRFFQPILTFVFLCMLATLTRAQTEVKIGEFYSLLKGKKTIDFITHSENASDSIFGYLQIENDTLYFTQVRKQKGEQLYYFFFEQKAALKDIDLGPKHIWETNMVGVDKTFYYVDLLPVKGKTFYGKIVDKNRGNSLFELTEIGIYCYTKLLGKEVYDQIETKIDR
jgi:hypothetical protein